MSVLIVWQTHHGYTDRQAAEVLGLEPREFSRQKATRPSRQTSLLCILSTMFKRDLAAIGEAAATLARPPRAEEPGPDLSSDWD